MFLTYTFFYDMMFVCQSRSTAARYGTSTTLCTWAGSLPCMSQAATTSARRLPSLVSILSWCRRRLQPRPPPDHKETQAPPRLHAQIRSMISSLTTGSFSAVLSARRASPKSGRAHRTYSPRLLHMLIFLSCLQVTRSVGTEARVGIDPARMPEVVTTKLAGIWEAQGPSTTDSTRIKRSYQRAFARACRNGGAYYKCVWREHQWFRPVRIRTRFLPRTSGPSTSASTRSLRVLTWNTGGLHAQVFREVETYAKDALLDICVLQETR